MILTPQEIKQQTRALWKECFHDSEEFMDIYFEEKYTDQQNITVREDGKVIGAMQVIPYPMTFAGTPQTRGRLATAAAGPPRTLSAGGCSEFRDSSR